MFLSRHFNSKQLAEGIYMLEAAEQGGAMSNAGLIDMGDFVLIFDTFNTPQAGRDLREAALSLFNKPIRYVINSHWHGDHIRGNQMFSEEVIISSKRTRELMMNTQPQWLDRMQKLLPNLEEDIAKLNVALTLEKNEIEHKKLSAEQCYLQEIRESIQTLKVTLPELTYERKMTIHGSARTVEIVSLGSAHTECDSILYSPSDSIAFVGDIVAVHNHPLFVDGDPVAWLEALSAVEKLNVDLIVPGHGPVCNSNYIHQMKQYILELINISEQVLRDEISRDTSRIAIPEAYLAWAWESIFYRNLEFLTTEK